LTAEKEDADYFEALVVETSKASGKPAADIAHDCANVMLTDLFGLLKRDGRSIGASPISPAAFGELQALKLAGAISGRTAKDVFEEMFVTRKSAKAIVDEKGLKQLSDSSELEALVDKAFADSPKQLEQYRAGKESLFGFFVGQVMKATGGQANPQVVNDILKKKLAN
jgi:aspartyl-tRNA(Asn)/glutamyl-tRNA(Gln) amidotransferase subunit B